MDTFRNEVGDRIRRAFAAGRERGPVVQVDERQLAESRNDDIAAENIQTRGGGGPIRQALQLRETERIFPGRPGVEPVEESATGHAIEFYLVPGPMRLDCRSIDSALRKIGQPGLEAFARID